MTTSLPALLCVHVLRVLYLSSSWSGGQAASPLSAQRNATNQLLNYVLSLDVARDKVPPLSLNARGNMTVNLRVNVDILYIRGVNDAGQTASTSSYIQMVWTDEALAWDESLYSGISFIEVSSDVIWTPGVIIPNCIETMRAKDFIDTVVIHSTGLVETKVFMSIETFCPLDHTLFPYDEQHCPIILYAFSDYVEWTITSQTWTNTAEARQVLASDWDLLQAIPALMYLPQYHKHLPLVQLRLKRKTLYYSVCLILPMVLTSYMNTLVFLLPLQAGEKISYLVTILVSTSVFIGFFSDTMPRGLDEMPSSMKMLVVGIVESFVVLLATLLVLHVYHYQEDAKAKEAASSAAGKPNDVCQDRENDLSPVVDDLDDLDQLPNKDKQGDFLASNLTSKKQKDNFFISRFHGPAKGRVSPLVEKGQGRNHAAEETQGGGKKEGSRGRWSWRKKVTAHHLDAMFFVVFFVGNTVAHGLILFTELHVHAGI